jgi:hypothetical protein
VRGSFSLVRAETQSLPLPIHALQYKAHSDHQLKKLPRLKLTGKCDMFASPQPSFACAVNPEALRGLWPTNISLREHFYVYNNQMAVLDGSLSQAIDHHFAAAWLDAASGSSIGEEL